MARINQARKKYFLKCYRPENPKVNIEGEQQLSGLAKKVTISKKSTIFVLS